MSEKLRKGERQRKDGRFEYRITKDKKGYSVSAKTIAELRVKKEELEAMLDDSFEYDALNCNLNDIYDRWKKIKRGIKPNTFANYCYMYEKFVPAKFGGNQVCNIHNSDVIALYNDLHDKCGLKARTIESVHSVVHQLFTLAIRDGIININPSDGALKGLKLDEKRKERESHEKKIKYLTAQQEIALFEYIKESVQYRYYYPVLKFLAETGMRVGEVCALQHSDIDYKNNLIYVNKTLAWYIRREKTVYKEIVYEIHSPKTEASERMLYLSNELKDLLRLNKEYEDDYQSSCCSSIGRYNDFLFISKEGIYYKGDTLNKILHRIINAYNKEMVPTGAEAIPHVHCHMLRHSYNTRMMEAGIPVDDRMRVLGQSDPQVNIRIYTHESIEIKQKIVKEAMEKTKEFCYNRNSNEG